LTISLTGCPAGMAARLRRTARGALESEGFARGRLDISIVDAAAMRRLHKEWLDDESVTDVLTFDLRDRPLRGMVDGQISICESVARRQARALGVDWRDELLLYVIHGCLHLCGYDDRRPADARRMGRRQQELLEALRVRAGGRG
jgi:probable rRNA maturation factor